MTTQADAVGATLRHRARERVLVLQARAAYPTATLERLLKVEAFDTEEALLQPAPASTPGAVIARRKDALRLGTLRDGYRRACRWAVAKLVGASGLVVLEGVLVYSTLLPAFEGTAAGESWLVAGLGATVIVTLVFSAHLVRRSSWRLKLVGWLGLLVLDAALGVLRLGLLEAEAALDPGTVALGALVVVPVVYVAWLASRLFDEGVEAWRAASAAWEQQQPVRLHLETALAARRDCEAELDRYRREALRFLRERRRCRGQLRREWGREGRRLAAERRGFVRREVGEAAGLLWAAVGQAAWQLCALWFRSPPRR